MTTSLRDAPIKRNERGEAQANYVQLYMNLAKWVRDTGLLRRRYGYYWTLMSAIVGSLAAIAVGMVFLGDSWFQLLLAAPLALVLGQIGFIGHDAAHRQIFRSHRANEWAVLIFGSLLGGLSGGWWLSKHTRHHDNPNKEGDDPDVDSTVVVFTPNAASERRGLAAFLSKRQGYFFFPLLLLEGLHLHVSSVRRIVDRSPMKRRAWEATFVAGHFAVYIAALLIIMSPAKAAAFLGLQLALYGLYLGGAFTPNHVGMPIVPKTMKLDFLRRQILTSRNISGRWPIRFLLGGLNYQVEHHLFPSMPRPNLRKIRPMVRDFCADHGIRYTEQSLASAYRDIIQYLNKVGVAKPDPFGCPLAAYLRAPA